MYEASSPTSRGDYRVRTPSHQVPGCWTYCPVSYRSTIQAALRSLLGILWKSVAIHRSSLSKSWEGCSPSIGVWGPTLSAKEGRWGRHTYRIAIDQVNSVIDQKHETRREIIGWLSENDCEEMQDCHVRKRFQHTGQWLLDDYRFTNWRDGRQSDLLWCHGPRKLQLSYISCSINA